MAQIFVIPTILTQRTTSFNRKNCMYLNVRHVDVVPIIDCDTGGGMLMQKTLYGRAEPTET